jgi:hypothetical protein
LSLYTTYNKCLDVLKTRETSFRNWQRVIHPDHLAKWSAMDDTPRMRGKEIISVHVARYKIGMTGLVDMFKDFTECLRFPGPPTQEKAYKALLASEVQAHDTSEHDVMVVHFINNGLRLERDQ